MICHFLLLKAPIRSSKRFRKVSKYDLVYNTGKNELPWSEGAVPGYYCPPTQFSLASATARSSCLAAEAEFPGKCLAKETLSYRQDRRCSFKSVPQSVVRPGEAKRPRPNTMLLLSALIKG